MYLLAAYVQVDTETCSSNCTQRDHVDIPTTPMPPTTLSTSKVSTIITTEEIKTETTKITNSKEVTETIKDKTDASTIFIVSTTLETTTKGTATNTAHGSSDVTNIETTTVIDENTIPEETTLLTSVATSTDLGQDCNPNDCTLPSTWETSSVGETRDFVQILKERYGDRIKILRDTTHFPKLPLHARKNAAFIPGHHRERQ